MIAIPRNHPLRIMMCHAYYQQRGGEDESFDAECRMLESRGHEVVKYTFDNVTAVGWSVWQRGTTGFWNSTAAGEVKAILQRNCSQVLHCTNLFPFLSPSVYRAAREQGVAIVQSLRNYRAGCVNALLLRNGRVCEECLGSGFAWSGVRHACYRGSRLASATVALQTAFHRWLDASQSAVDWHFAPSEFARQVLIKARIPEDRFSVKPNFLDPDPGPGEGLGGYAVFVGRLSEEKGLTTLLDAWRRLPYAPDLRIIGDGPQAALVRQLAASDPRIRLFGRLTQSQVLDELRQALCLIMPSIWYETFGRTVMEALAIGTPVIASRLGAMAELVEHERTGFLFAPGDAAELAGAIERLQAMPLAQRAAMRKSARQTYLEKYTADRNYLKLMEIYERALAVASSRRRSTETSCTTSLIGTSSL